MEQHDFIKQVREEDCKVVLSQMVDQYYVMLKAQKRLLKKVLGN